MTRNTHDMLNDHFGTAKAEQIASGTPTSGYVPIAIGAGAAAAWSSLPPSGGLLDLLTGNDAYFTASLGSWTNTGGTASRDTGRHLASQVASMKFVATASSQHVDLVIGGTFSAGKPYLVVVFLSGDGSVASVDATFGLIGTDAVTGTMTLDTVTGFTAWSLIWTPSADRTGVSLRLQDNWSSGTDNFWVGQVRAWQSPGAIAITDPSGSTTYLPINANGSDTFLKMGTGGTGLQMNHSGTIYYENRQGTAGLDASFNGEAFLYAHGTSAAGNLNASGLEIEVGPDYVGLYISEKDSSTIQIYDDGGGSYNIEFVEQGTVHFKFVAVAGGVATPALGMLPQYASAPSSPVEGQSYYDTVLHKSRTWDGSAWQNHW